MFHVMIRLLKREKKIGKCGTWAQIRTVSGKQEHKLRISKRTVLRDCISDTKKNLEESIHLPRLGTTTLGLFTNHSPAFLPT